MSLNSGSVRSLPTGSLNMATGKVRYYEELISKVAPGAPGWYSG